MTKRNREKIWAKHDKRCGYCGKGLQYKEMQIDHIIPKTSIWWNVKDGKNHPDNLMPSCRKCNFYKSSHTLDYFREIMKTLHVRIEQQFITRLGLAYGIVELRPFDGIFYFERKQKS